MESRCGEGTPAIESGLAAEGPRRLDQAALLAPTQLDHTGFHQAAESIGAEFRAATPCPQVEVRNFLPPGIRLGLLEECERLDTNCLWRDLSRLDSAGVSLHQGTLSCSRVEDMSRLAREFFWELNSGTFLRFLEKITGIEGLIADPRLRGGGLQKLPPGALQPIRGGAARHTRNGLYRRLQIVVFLNENCPTTGSDDRGQAQSGGQTRPQGYSPGAGRCQIFRTDYPALQNYPRPPCIGADNSLLSASLFYYTCEAAKDSPQLS